MQKIDFNTGWLFCKENDVEQEITLPHDAMLYEKRSLDAQSTGACACFEGGRYCYSKKFIAPKEWKNKCVQFYFEGSYRNNKVFLNGQEIGGCKYGYTSFLVDAQEMLKFEEENKLEVFVDNSKMPNSRWYTGSGIYRPVWILTGGKEHIVWQGVRIQTCSIEPALIQVDVDHKGGRVEIEICKDGICIAHAKENHCKIEIQNAKLWSEDTPDLYQCKVKLIGADGHVADEVTEAFGIRLIEYSSKGLFINHKETLLRGGCIHSDNGVLGAKSYHEAEWRKIRKLKKVGFNAIRCSHNPCAEELLRACDYYGMYVIDETWDMWYKRKNKYDYANDFRECFMQDIYTMVKKNFNHPSVLMYSIANEISEPATDEGIQVAKDIVQAFHQLDSTRPITGGINPMIIAQAASGRGIYKEEGGRDSEKELKMATSSMLFNMMTAVVGTGMNNASKSKKIDHLITPIMDALDIAGYNYASGRYPLEGKCHPNRVIFGSETFVSDLAKNWAMVEKYPYLVGDFLWTAWDYLGEAGSGAWAYTKDGIGFEKPYPWLLADMGVLDILGNPNGEAFHIAAIWGKLDGAKICVRPLNKDVRPAKSSWRETAALPSWSWNGCEGKKAVVEVYSNADYIELFNNGKKVGKKKVKDCRAIFKTLYVPGVLEAIAYNMQDQEVGRDTLQSAVGEMSIRINAEKEEVTCGEICYFNLELVGENEIVESNQDMQLHVDVKGGTLLGFGSANPRTEESFVTGMYTTYYGYAQAIVRVEDTSEIVLCVSAGKMEKTCRVKVIGAEKIKVF